MNDLMINDSKRDMCGISRNVNVIKYQLQIRTYVQLKVMFREGHFLTVLLENGLPLAAWCEEVSLTMPEPSCCRRPEPWEQVDGLRERMLCILLLSKNGTLLLVFGMLPPCTAQQVSVRLCPALRVLPHIPPSALVRGMRAIAHEGS